MHNEYYVKNNFLIIQRKFGFRRISKLKPRPKKIFARGGWEAEGGPKQPPRPKEQRRTFSLWYKLIQSTKEAKTGVRSSLVPYTVPLMPLRTMKCTLVVSQYRQKAVCKSRPRLVPGLVFLNSDWIYLSCTGKKWITVDAPRWSIFPKMVTY